MLSFLLSHFVPGLLLAIAVYVAVIHWHVVSRLAAVEENVCQSVTEEGDSLYEKVEEEAILLAKYMARMGPGAPTSEAPTTK